MAYHGQHHGLARSITGETAWDLFINDFESIIDIATIFNDRSSTAIPQDPTNYQQTPFSTVPDPFRNVDSRLETSESQPLLAPIPARIVKPTFSLSLGIIPLLYMVSTRCRDPVLRRRAIHLLSICNRREGIWDSWLASRVSTRIVEIEEDGAREYLQTLTNGEADGGDESIRITSMLQIPGQV